MTEVTCTHSDEVTRAVFRYGAYAYFSAIIDQETGRLTLIRDTQAYTYAWGRDPRSTGEPSFVPFLCQASRHYIANKLCKVREAYNAEDTRKHVYEEIITLRKDGWLSRDRARELWDGLRYVDWYHGPDVVALALGDLGFEDASEYLRYTPREEYLFLQDVMIPAVQEFCANA